MSKLSEQFHKSITLDPDSIEERYIAELEQQNKELKETLTELSRYSFFDIDWNEAAIIKSLIKSALNNIK